MRNRKPMRPLILAATTILLLATALAAAPPTPDPNDEGAVCVGMCDSIQKLCAEDIAEGNVAGHDLKDGILDEASCLLMCEAEWTDKTFNCVSGADSCAQFFDEAPYCAETEERGEPATPATADKGCAAACRNYAKCAGYGEDIGPQDQAYAYKSCMQVCPSWTIATQNCIASTAIHSPADCAAQTMCMFGSMQNMIPKNMPRR